MQRGAQAALVARLLQACTPPGQGIAAESVTLGTVTTLLEWMVEVKDQESIPVAPFIDQKKPTPNRDMPKKKIVDPKLGRKAKSEVVETTPTKPNQTKSTIQISAMEDRKNLWGRLHKLLEQELGWQVPPGRKELLQLGDVATLSHLIVQVDAQLGISAKLEEDPALLPPPPPTPPPPAEAEEEENKKGSATKAPHPGYAVPTRGGTERVKKVSTKPSVPLVATKPLKRSIPPDSSSNKIPPDSHNTSKTHAEQQARIQHLEAQMQKMLHYQQIQQQMILRQLQQPPSTTKMSSDARGQARTPQLAFSKGDGGSKTRHVQFVGDRPNPYQLPQSQGAASEDPSSFDNLASPVLKGKSNRFGDKGPKTNPRAEAQRKTSSPSQPAHSSLDEIHDMENAIALRMHLRQREDLFTQRHEKEEAWAERQRQREKDGRSSPDRNFTQSNFTLHQAAVWTQARLQTMLSVQIFVQKRTVFLASRLIRDFMAFRFLERKRYAKELEDHPWGKPRPRGLGCSPRCYIVFCSLEQRITHNPLLPRSAVRRHEALLCKKCKPKIKEISIGTSLL